MFSRKSRLAKREDAVAERGSEDGGDLREHVDDLTEALEAARDAIARASASASRKVAGVTTETARQAAEATKEAARSAAEASRQAAEASRKASRRQAKAARQTADRLSDSDLADATRRAAGKLFPEKAKERRKARRKRRRGLAFRAAGVAGLGALVGWLTMSKRGQEARQTLKQQATKASERGWEKMSESRAGDAEATDASTPPAGVTSIHDGVGTQPRTPRD
ncbi:MAG TPA: hypothetical protein VG276_25130 [Actinomycetes bacterium]|nr:hypothetical protein [Actinomycetes bacterium]